MFEDEKSKEKELGKKDRVEILMENMIHDFKAVTEGHGILLAEVKEGNRKSEERDKELEDMIKSNSKALHKKIDDVKTELGQRMGKIEQKVEIMDKKIEDLGIQQQKTDKKIDKLDEKMTNRQDKIEEKIDLVHQKVFIGH